MNTLEIGNELRGRSLITLLELSPSELQLLVNLAGKVKEEKKKGIFPRRLQGKNVALIFEKARTRCSFVVAAADEGAHAESFGQHEIHLGVKEDIRDTARVLSRFVDGIEYRGHDHAVIEALAKHATVPVWNGLTDFHHPTQALADCLTLQEEFGHLKGLRVCYLGDASNNTATSLMLACAMMGIHLVMGAPEEYQPVTECMGKAISIGKETGGTIEIQSLPHRAVIGADAIYTDVWVSMGEEHKPHVHQKVELLKPYQVNASLMAATGKPSTIFMHCLPANKGMDVTEEVFESSAARVFQQAENRLHTIKALMLATM